MRENSPRKMKSKLVIRSFLSVSLRRKSVRDSKPKILDPRPYRSDPGYFVPTPTELEGLARVCGWANLVSKNTRCIEADRRLLRRRKMRGKLPRTAVLVFFGIPRRYPEYVALFPKAEDNPHGTTKSNNRALVKSGVSDRSWKDPD